MAKKLKASTQYLVLGTMKKKGKMIYIADVGDGQLTWTTELLHAKQFNSAAQATRFENCKRWRELCDKPSKMTYPFREASWLKITIGLKEL